MMLQPLLEGLIPHIPKIIDMARPFFTKNSTESKSSDVLPKQILELQEAAVKTDESLRGLASTLKEAIERADLIAANASKEILSAKRLAFVSFCVGTAGIVTGLMAIFGK